MIKHCSCEITFTNGFNTKTYEDKDLQRQYQNESKTTCMHACMCIVQKHT